MKIGKLKKEVRRPVHTKLDDSNYKQLLMYCEMYRDEYGDKITVREMSEQILIAFLDEDKEFSRWRKRNPDKVEEIKRHEVIEESAEDDEQEGEAEPEPEVQTEHEPVESETDDENDESTTVEDTAPEQNQSNESHESWLRRMNIVSNG